MELTIMNFNVEEYFHDYDTTMFLTQLAAKHRNNEMSPDDAKSWLSRLEAHVFEKIALVRGIIEKSDPDILCMTEHSCGVDHQLLASMGLASFVDEAFLSPDRINAALLPEGYGFCFYPTGEKIAKYSEIANLVAWRMSKFRKTSNDVEPGTLITPVNKPIPGLQLEQRCFTPRSVACVELRPVGEVTPFIVCSTHLLGGRFEDSCWALDNEAGSNERVNQLMAIEKFIGTGRFERGVPVIIAGDFNAMRKGFVEGEFSKVSKGYAIGQSMIFSRAQLEKDYLESYVPYQTAVHRMLEELGYIVAYGRSDACPEMKTTRHGGCTDWIYSRGFRSKCDEEVIFANPQQKEGASDHNAVVCTLIFPTVPRPTLGFGPGLPGSPIYRTM